ncbi:outer membrane receptor for ferrienterochelin and colicins [Fodinibius roseus]|uniref:Outer membrane receptor for ferrienterochelin and colicins n=1 Tax=Fodinibius roseus TaxID=1194090 RepID=A0A1M4UUG3_9BACT|nr:TonB-dependent receptor [Fodinibius roseus]SHE60240.1 outer membrane receptor for ferrienterochelin and colicins [Fodinibius roseus]
MLRLLGLLFFLLFTSSAQAQNGTIRGTVSSEGEAVAGANVTLVETQKGTSTDANGRFLLTNIEPGAYRLVVSAVGFARHQKKITVTKDTQQTLAIRLKRKVEELDQVVVTGTMRETYVKESPVKVSVINARRLQQGKTSSNIMDLIGSVNGLSTQLNCGVCGTNAIRINGVEGPNTAVLIDGMPLMGALASVYGLNGISPSVIDRVEVIKGPQSTLYGTQALGGVVNIITKNPANTPSFTADMYGKSTREGNLNLAASPQSERFRGFVSGDILRMQHYFDKNNDGFNDVPKRSRVALFGKGVVTGKKGEQIWSIATKLYDEERTGGVQAYSGDLRGSGEIYGESIYTRRVELLTEYRPRGLNQQLRISGALTYHDQDSYYGTEHYDARQGIVYGQATWDRQLTGTWKLLAGTTVRYQIYNDNTPATSEGTDRRFIPGVFAQSELSMGVVTLLGGLRLDHHTEHGLVTSPRLSAKYRPSERTTVRVSGGTGFRVVNVFTEDHAALTGSREVVFTEDLEPERSRSITASVEHIIYFGSNPMTIGMDGFYTRFSNKIIPDYDQDPNLIVYENLDGHSVTQGASISIEQNFTSIPLNYNAGFTLMDVFTSENNERKALTYAPGYMGNLGVTYRFQWGLSLDYTANLLGPKRMPDNYVEDFERDRWSPTYATHNLKLTKEFTDVNSTRGVGLEAYFSVENLFDYTQGSPLVDAATPFSPDFDTIYTWGPIVGRTLALGARLNLR